MRSDPFREHGPGARSESYEEGTLLPWSKETPLSLRCDQLRSPISLVLDPVLWGVSSQLDDCYGIRQLLR